MIEGKKRKHKEEDKKMVERKDKLRKMRTMSKGKGKVWSEEGRKQKHSEVDSGGMGEQYGKRNDRKEGEKG